MSQHRHPEYDNGKAASLVFAFSEQLHVTEGYGAPEPDFMKWVEHTMFASIGTAGDAAFRNDLPEGERQAWKLFHDALAATEALLNLYRTDLKMFQSVARQISFLPALLSSHPDNQRFNREYLATSQLGREGPELQSHPQHLARQSWPVRYAYAIIATIELTLDTYGSKLPFWAVHYGYGVRHPVPIADYEWAARRMGWSEEKIRAELPKYRGIYEILPVWTKGLASLRRPLNASHVLDYWRVGKQIILEEWPDFHLRPEWSGCRRRKYKGGAKPGTVQHAIFKDILVALRSIAGTDGKAPDGAAGRAG